MTAQLAVGWEDRYHAGIRPTHVVWLSENSRPAWILGETWRLLYGGATEEEKEEEEESPAWTQERIVWIPSGPEHILEDGILLIGVHVLRDGTLLDLAESRLPELLDADWLDLTKLDHDALDELRESSRQIVLNQKLVVTVLANSSLQAQLPVLERYPMAVEVCTVSYSRLPSGFAGSGELQAQGSLTQRPDGFRTAGGPAGHRYGDVNLW